MKSPLPTPVSLLATTSSSRWSDRRAPLLGLALLFLSAGPARAQEEARIPNYETTFSRAATLEAEASFEAAAQLLGGLIPHYPQDYSLHLQLGWLYFNAGQPKLAEQAYRRALSLSGGALAPRLGLAWTALRQRQKKEAIAIFSQVLEQDPRNASAREGLSLAQNLRALRVRPLVAATVHARSNRPESPWSLGLTLRIPAVIADRWLLEATYRHLTGSTTGTPAPNGRRSGASITLDGQDELQAAIGVRFPSFEVALQGGRIFAQDAAPSPMNVAGLRMRVFAWGEASAELSESFYPDTRLGRAALGWRSPGLSGVQLQPTMTLQWDTQSLWPGGSLVLSYHRSDLDLWLGAKVGEEHRPIYLFVPAAFNLEEVITAGLWAGFQARLPSGWALGLELEVHRLRGDTTATTDGLLTLVSLVIARSN